VYIRYFWQEITKYTVIYGVFIQFWPTLYIYTVFDHIFGDFPAGNIVYTPYKYGSDQPYTC